MSLIVTAWLQYAQAQLPDSDSPRLDAELLLMQVLGVNRTWLFTWPDHTLSDEQQQQVEALLARRQQGEPLAYIIGTREFWSLELAVAPSTLIPRPDTETLVEWALTLRLSDKARVLDLGTGTGAIALALASERPHWQMTASDMNADAVALAKHNAKQLALAVDVQQGSWYQALSSKTIENSSGATPRFDLIVSNPPYIDPSDIHLNQGDVRFEPRSALVAEHHGLADIEHIIEHAPPYLNANGWLLLEHGYDQAEAVCALLKARGFTQVSNRLDLGGNPRISGGCWCE